MKVSVRAACIAATMTGVVMTAPPDAVAQSGAYPAKPVRIIVPQSPGSVSDTVARVYAQRATAALGQPFLVDTRPGAGGMTGSELGARAPADGYTLLIASISSHGTVPAIRRKMSFDAVKDFAPISLLATTPNVVIVHPSLPVRTTKELIALARARPGEINIGTQGVGSSQHLATEHFKIMAGGLRTLHVPYKGSGQSILGLVTGEVSVLFPTLALATPHIEAGKARALAVTSSNRLAERPALPAVAETLPGFQMLSWLGLLAPAGTPPDVIALLNEVAVKGMAMPEVRKTMTGVGMTATSSTPADFGRYIQSEIARWTKVARAANVTVE